MSGPNSPAFPNLVIVRAGPNSLHPRWLKGGVRNFDLLVAAYDPSAPRADGEIRIDVPGRKVAGFDAVFDACPEIFERYETIALVDDDIETDARSLSGCFRIGKEKALAIWQPSLTHDSYYSYAVFLTNRRFRLRFVNFVEMMCPFFTADALRAARPLFSEGWETGIDTLWCRQFDNPLGKCAVIDEVAVRHTRPVGSTKQMNGFDASESYDAQVDRFLGEKNASFEGPVAYAGILRNAAPVRSRTGILARTWQQLGHVLRTPMSRALSLRLTLAHMRHVAIRPLNDSRLF